jgi:hypothetical protein
MKFRLERKAINRQGWRAVHYPSALRAKSAHQKDDKAYQ